MTSRDEEILASIGWTMEMVEKDVADIEREDEFDNLEETFDGDEYDDEYDEFDDEPVDDYETVYVTFGLPRIMRDRIDLEADCLEISRSEYIRCKLREALDAADEQA